MTLYAAKQEDVEHYYPIALAWVQANLVGFNSKMRERGVRANMRARAEYLNSDCDSNFQLPKKKMLRPQLYADNSSALSARYFESLDWRLTQDQYGVSVEANTPPMTARRKIKTRKELQ